MFRGILLSKPDDVFRAAVTDLDERDLPDGDVQLRVEYSTLNFKDALAITNRSPVVRKWPMVAGIDGAGTVEASTHPAWRQGDRAVVTGWGVGESHWGCLAQKARLKGEWLVPLPAGMTLRDAMAIGTAGFTAMLCVLALQDQGVGPAAGDVLVTGAAGGVGSVAVALLGRLGYRVVASTGRPSEAADHLRALGASEILDRTALGQPGRPLQKERWAGVVDAVGSVTLANACAQTRHRGVVTACGLAQGMDFPATVAPFILRGVRLIGIDSVLSPAAERQRAWWRLARDLDRDALAQMTTEVPLTGAIAAAADLLAGRVRGRCVVDVNG
jgi:acrylyl-CoA reductase (NADPH)